MALRARSAERAIARDLPSEQFSAEQLDAFLLAACIADDYLPAALVNGRGQVGFAG